LCLYFFISFFLSLFVFLSVCICLSHSCFLTCLSLFLFPYHFLSFLSFLFIYLFLLFLRNVPLYRIHKNALGKYVLAFFKFDFIFPILLAYDNIKQALTSKQHDRSVNQERWLPFMQCWWYRNDDGDWRVRPVYFCCLLFSSHRLSMVHR
jgi:hypothetical protein